MLSCISIFFIIYLFRSQMKRCDVNYSKKLLKRSALVMLFLEIFRIVWSTFYYGFNLKNIRFDWCNQISLALPFIILSEKQELYPYIDILSFMGGAGVLIYPIWVFYDYAGIHIMSVQSMISHTLMVIIPLSITFVSGHWEKEKSIRKPLTAFILVAFIAYVMSRTLNVNYLIMIDADGIPLLRHLPFPWYWLIAFPCLIVLISGVRLMFYAICRKISKHKSIISEYYNMEYEDKKVESVI